MPPPGTGAYGDIDFPLYKVLVYTMPSGFIFLSNPWYRTTLVDHISISLKKQRLSPAVPPITCLMGTEVTSDWMTASLSLCLSVCLSVSLSLTLSLSLSLERACTQSEREGERDRVREREREIESEREGVRTSCADLESFARGDPTLQFWIQITLIASNP